MEEHHYNFSYSEFRSQEEMAQIDSRLINKAKAVAKNAWAEYSGFLVGAAALLENGEIITGNNQENAAYPSGLCAERVTIYYANAIFPDVPVKTLAIAAIKDGKYLESPIPPCGACRQVIMETQNRFRHPIRLLLYGEEKILLIEDASFLLPFPFTGF